MIHGTSPLKGEKQFQKTFYRRFSFIFIAQKAVKIPPGKKAICADTPDFMMSEYSFLEKEEGV